MDHKLKSIQNLLAIFLVALLGGCAHPSKTPEETIARTADDAGTSGCEDCYLIKTLLSPTAASGTYAPKGEKDTPTGKWISASIALGATNRAGGPSNGVALEKFVYEHTSTLTEDHLFEGPFKASGNKPFRLFVRILHNSSFTDQDVYLVTSKAEYIRLPPVSFNGINRSLNCFNTGCTWNTDHAISAKYINQILEAGEPLKIYVGSDVPRRVQSLDGYNRGNETHKAGVNLVVRTEFLKGFIDTVKANINVQ